MRLLIALHFAVGAVRVRLPLLVHRQLRLRRHDQAIVMLGMLKIVFRLYAVAAGMRVARQLQVFFVDMSGRAANLHVWTVGVHRSPQDILRPMLVLVLMLLMMLLAAAPTIVPTPAPLAVLLILSWSHEHRFLALIQSRLTLRTASGIA